MKKLLLAIGYIFIFVVAVVALEVPYLTGRVNDYAHILSEETVSQLTIKLEQHETLTTNQIVVLTLPSLEGEDLETFTNKVFETWQLGQKARDNGVLLLVSIQDRKLRIEVGYGLEGVLTDGLCGTIIRNEIVPPFRRGNYDAGITAGVDAIISAIKGEFKAEQAGERAIQFSDLKFPYNLIVGLFVFSILGVFTLIGLFSKGFTAWFLYIFLIPFYFALTIGIFGLPAGLILTVTYLIGFPLVKKFIGSQSGQNWMEKHWPEVHKTLQKGISWSSGSGGGSSWTSSSGWSSGGGFSGGFSGGGGSSGGGGASGSW